VPTPDPARDFGGTTPSDAVMEITPEWVENRLLPIMRDLSRRGILIAYDSGIEPRSKGSQLEEPPRIMGRTNNIVALTDAQISVFSISLSPGMMVSGRVLYAIRASDGTEHQSLIGHILFAMLNKNGTLYTNPDSTVSMPDMEIFVASSGTLSTGWAITTSGSIATMRVTPTGSLSETLYVMEYTVETFPQVPVIPA
jgi:hypothetical protein